MEDLALKAVDYVNQTKELACSMSEELTRQAKESMDEVIESVLANIERLDRNEYLSRLKKDLNEFCKDGCKRLNDIKEDSIHRLKDKWEANRMQIENSISAVQENFDKSQMESVRQDVREIIRFVENLVNDCIKIIKGYGNEAVLRLRDICKKARKDLKNY